MLVSLYIKDYALIEEISVEFGKALNIITGETGAGKSIIIDALGLILGERASSEVIRKGANKSIVEAVFYVEGNNKISKLLSELEVENNNELIIRREISVKGTNRCFLNDTPVNLSSIKEAGYLLVDLHGQHEHQSLLRNETHIDFLDQFAQPERELNNYKLFYNNLIQTEKELKELENKKESLKEKKDIYAFQIKEIDSVSPLENEDEEIEKELNILENSERLLELSNLIYNRLYDDENAVNDNLGEIKNYIEEIVAIDSSLSESVSEIESALTLIKDVASNIRDYKNSIDIDPQKLESLRARLSSIQHLKKKYGGTVNKILEFRKKIGEEYDKAENFEERINELNERINQLKISAGEKALILSKKRKSFSKEIEKNVVSTLYELGIPDAKFEVNISNIESNSTVSVVINNKIFTANENGIDNIEFYISTNTGEDVKPLIKVASGGEISRIMLALKSILAKQDKLPLLIFDEIDTGVSGRIAQKVGNVMKTLSSFHQIIAITHLPQIAGLANSHYIVEKKSNNERVISSIRKLNEEERLEEVAKLLSGENITEASLLGAKELMK